MSRFLQQRNNRIFIGDDGRIVVPYLETYLSYGCNLRCSFCGNMSPLSCGLESKDTLLWSMESWGKRFRPGYFALGGGEPLLHPEFMEIVAGACRSFPDSIIAVLTNGILLNNLSDADLRKLAELQRVDFRISEKQHTDPTVVQQSAERLRSHAISHTVKTTHFKKLYEVDHIGSPVPSNSNPAVAWSNCYANDCRNIIGDTLTYCSRLALIRRSLANGELDKRWYRANGHTPMTLANSQQEMWNTCTRAGIPNVRSAPNDWRTCKHDRCRRAMSRISSKRQKQSLHGTPLLPSTIRSLFQWVPIRIPKNAAATLSAVQTSSGYR
ncbi:MAG: radical SAM protein [Planctomycetaceae bacterium]|nr:radical SAM protein [Planctomycetaceae bacterium]